MFHRQSVCGLILGLTLVILAGVFRPAEGTAPRIEPTVASEQATETSLEAGSSDSMTANSNREENETPGQTTSTHSTEAPGKLP